MPVSNSIAVSTFCNLLELLNVPSDYSSLARLSTSVHCTETSAVFERGAAWSAVLVGS